MPDYFLIEQFAQQLAEAHADEAALEARLTPQMRASALQAEITRLAEEVAALGAVNLAALEELTTSRERKAFLAAQSADLKGAITTLEDAIRKIDRETRELLQQTFDQVNAQFGQLFPKLFGGGEARLLMAGEEILDAGVQVMAQPPGKRNSTIHLLSGGEKALAATALVFALFKLNPAPFCLLDEVDAPLDDPNTERFCALVRSMTSRESTPDSEGVERQQPRLFGCPSPRRARSGHVAQHVRWCLARPGDGVREQVVERGRQH